MRLRRWILTGIPDGRAGGAGGMTCGAHAVGEETGPLARAWARWVGLWLRRRRALPLTA